LRGVGATAAEEDFNRFDAALCDVLVAAFLLDVFAVPLFLASFLATLVLEAFDDLALDGCFEMVLGDFLRDFLDIRLPFVAFGGPIIRVLRVLAGEGESSRWLGKSDGRGIWFQGIQSTACPLVE
jgi:hypothetical protein